MPASKLVHVLAILRKNIGLNQSELARMIGCSASTIQSVEANRLELSESLAARISANTSVDIKWLLANDVTVPMPARHLHLEGSATMTEHVCTIFLLTDVFSRLFAATRRLKSTSWRRTLQLTIADQLETLKKTEQDLNAEPLVQVNQAVFQYFDKHPKALEPALANMLNLDYLEATAKPDNVEAANSQHLRGESKKSKRQETVSPNQRKVPKRTRRSA